MCELVGEHDQFIEECSMCELVDKGDQVSEV